MTRPAKAMSWGNSGRRIVELKGFGMWNYLAVLMGVAAVLVLITPGNCAANSADTGPSDAAGGAADGVSNSAPVVVGADELGFDEFFFVKHKPYSSDHYYTDINNGTSEDRFLPDNGICVYNVRTQQERTVATAAALPGGKGFIGKISLSFDARKVIFDFRENPGSGFRLL